MKKIFLALSFLAVCLTAVPAQPVLTQDYRSEVSKQTQAFGGKQGANLGTPRDPRLVVAYVIQVLLGLVGVIFLGYTLYAGFLIMTSRGEEDKITKGKETLKTAIIGVVIVMSAYSITLLGARIASGGRSDKDSTYRGADSNPLADPNAAINASGDNWNIQVQQDPGDFIHEDPLQ